MATQNPRILLIEAFDHLEIVERWTWYFRREFGAKVSLCVADKYIGWAWERLHADVLAEQELGSDRLDKYDLILLITIGPDPQRWASVLAGRSYWVVGHNLAYWQGGPLAGSRPKTLARYLRDRRRRPDLLRLLGDAQYILLPLPEMCDHLLSWQPAWPVVNLPFAFPPKPSLLQPRSASDRSECFRIFIPGRVNSRLRDFAPLIEALRQLPAAFPPLEIVLAGKLESTDVPAALRAAKPDLQLVYRKEGFSSAEFGGLLHRSDVVLAPLRQYVRSGAYRETIGLTKTSGAIFDAIAAGKPLLTPHWHPKSGDWHHRFTSDKDIVAILTRFSLKKP